LASVTLRKVDKYYGQFHALRGVDLDIADGEFAVFVGPSGCGKSTLLRTIAGLEGSFSGSIAIGGIDVSRTAPSDRGVAMVFQSYALYPHMTVRENMDFGMRINNIDKAERDARIGNAARILQLEPYLDRKPAALSGGQRQRVAIGRAIVRQPSVFLFDEPLSNLDAKLRVQMRVELEALHRQLRATMIYVTHDQVEAMTMADKIVVLNEGRIEQVGRPLDLYNRPATQFVAGFLGSPSMNFFKAVGEGSATSNIARYGRFAIPLPPVEPAIPIGETVVIGVRPEHLKVAKAEVRAASDSSHPSGVVEGSVAVKETLGDETILYVDTGSADRWTVRTESETAIEPGDTVALSIPSGRIHVFDASGKALRR
jgi:ABC-type sugar transport system ATPase subunit